MSDENPEDIPWHHHPPPAFKVRLAAFAFVWLVALMITAPLAIPLLPMFPIGLFAAFINERGSSGSDSGNWLLSLGWLLYVVQAAFLFLTSSRIIYYIAYLVLVGMLILNVQGCRKVLNELSTIH